MLLCTNDAITVGTAIIPDEPGPAFASGVVWDAGTENNDESRATVPCLDGEGVSNADTADGEGKIEPHPGIAATVDLGEVFRWERTVMEVVVDQRGSQPLRSFDVGRNSGKPNEWATDDRARHRRARFERRCAHLHSPTRTARNCRPLGKWGRHASDVDSSRPRPGVVSVTQWRTGDPNRSR